MQPTNLLQLEKRWRHYREPVLLAASGGAIDTISFIALFGLFTAHVTGNLVVAGASLAGNSDGILAKLVAIPVFMLVVAVTTLVIQSRKTFSAGLLASLFGAEILLLALFALAGLLYQPFTDAGDIHVLIAGMLGVMAMGIRNATSRLLLASTSPSTMMTGNVTQLTIDIMSLIKNPDAENRAKLVKSSTSVAGFTIGAGAGAVAYIVAGFLSTLVPILLIAVVTVWEIRYMRSQAAVNPT
ncbi:YoaK family protein [Tatumella citrea]|uniref:DUF1275 family protein n=1 Tax=Tatumella citrea TaxID=53336 RepID=A0A1Y0L9E2_TATCI|nr:YoaK family protein [Tatumella citrea]ARU94681.1 hypothetical protein A7K98_13495 [Tatumella citrea]ARU98718.1 hypothetical protein A7K99_13480 [Tatumella citrea]